MNLIGFDLEGKYNIKKEVSKNIIGEFPYSAHHMYYAYNLNDTLFYERDLAVAPIQISPYFVQNVQFIGSLLFSDDRRV